MIRRRGMSILEVTVTGVLLVTLLMICLQLLGATAAGRRAVRDRQTALLTSANLMERVCALPWSELTTDRVSQMQVPADVRESLAGAELEIDLAQADGQPNAKRITILLRWQGRPGRPEHPVRLVAWRYRAGRAE